MDGADWLRTQLTSFGCASCGRPYRPDRIRILAQREELFFVDLGCEACGTQAVAVVTIQAEDGEAPRADAGDIELARIGREDTGEPSRPAVSADEVLQMHEFLAAFDGDFDRLFRAPGSPSS